MDVLDIPPVLRSALSHLTVSGTPANPAVEIVRTFATGATGPGTADEVRAILNEADPDTLVDLVIEGTATFETLGALATDLLRDGHPTREFLDARRA